MPHGIDDEKVEEAKSMNLGAPPMKNIPFAEFPKMLYLHPKDKAKEHKAIVVDDLEAEKAAKAKGYRDMPHQPVAPVVEEEVIEQDEYETGGAAADEKPAKPAKVARAKKASAAADEK